MKYIVKALLLVSIVVGGLFSPVTPSVSIESHSLVVGVQENVAYAQNTGYLYQTCSGGALDQATCMVKNALLGFYEYLWYYSTMIVAFLTGFAADILLFHSISSSTYRTGIVEAGWEILRNLINIVFIFSLLFIAFKMVFGSDSSGVKKTLIKTIVVALVVNFSLFMSYLVIDASNILGNVFYNRITVEGSGPDLNSGSTTDEIQSLAAVNEFFTGNSSFKSPSSAIVSKFNPQNIVGGAAGNVSFAQKWMIIFAAGGINILMIFLFVSILMLFLTRTVGLMIAAILSPLAFVTLTLPFGNAASLPYIGFHTWLKDLISLAFMAPVYLFFLFLVIMFANNDALWNSISVGGNSFLTSILTVFISFGLIAMILITAKRITKDMAGSLGGKIADGLTKTLTGAAVAAGTGAAVLATGGAAAAGLLARGGGAIVGGSKGKSLANFGKRLQTTKFDVSKMPGFSQTLGQTGIGKTLAKGINTSYADVDTGIRKGSYLTRAKLDDFKVGRPAKSVEEWEKKVKDSKDGLQTRKDENVQWKVENAQREAKEKAKQENAKVIVGIDPQGKKIYDVADETIEVSLEKRKAALAKRSSLEAKAEKDRIEAKQKEVQLEIDGVQDEIKQLNKNPSPTNKAQIEANRIKIETLKERKKDIEKTSLEGQIKQIEKTIEAAESDARSTVAKGISREQASRIGGGEIKTKPKIGGDPNNAEPKP